MTLKLYTSTMLTFGYYRLLYIHRERVHILSSYRQDAVKRKTAGIRFTHRPKISFFAPQGRLVAPIHVKFGTADGHVGPLGCTKFYLNWRRGWECGPKI